MAEATLTENHARLGGDVEPYLVYVLGFDDLFQVSTCALRLPAGAVAVGRDVHVTRPTLRDGGLVGVPDPFMSGRHFTIERDPLGSLLRDERSKNGTFVNGERVTERRLADCDLIQVGHSLLLYRELSTLMAAGLAGPPDDLRLGPTRTFCPEVAALLRDLRRIAPTQTSVLIVGETGAGKEVAARALHDLGGRDGPFRAVDCGAIPDTMFESTLFGHRRGAFTGATDKRVGEIGRAHGGTLFFDEVGNLTPANQAKLLRVLEEGRVFALGADEPDEVDVRWIAATNADLESAEARFRPDLLRRLAGFTLRLPPLRRRSEDLGVLTAYFLREAGVGRASMTAEAARHLYSCRFPGNLRQLRSVLQAAAALAEDEPIDLPHVEDTPTAPRLETTEPSRAPPPPPRERPTREALEAALVAARGNVSEAAQRLGTNRREVYRMINGLGLTLDRYRG